MKSVKVTTAVVEDGVNLEEHTIEVPLYESIRTDDIPKEVIANLVKGFTDEILTTRPDYAQAYRRLNYRIIEGD